MRKREGVAERPRGGHSTRTWVGGADPAGTPVTMADSFAHAGFSGYCVPSIIGRVRAMAGDITGGGRINCRSGDWWGCASYLLIVALGLWVSLKLVDGGVNWLWASLGGAAASVLLVGAVTSLIFGAVHVVWRWTRGYPFFPGDRVEVTRGPQAGARGRVAGSDQGLSNFEIVLEDTGNTMWVHASRLRRVRP